MGIKGIEILVGAGVVRKVDAAAGHEETAESGQG